MSTAEIPAATHTTPTEPLEAALRWACVLSAVLVSIPGWVTLSTIWGRTEYLAHGYMIPVVAAYLCHRDSEPILSTFRSGSPPPLGFLLVFAAMSLEALALLGDVMVLTGLGIPILFAATAYALGGRPLLRTTRLPIAFLVLMVPPPGHSRVQSTLGGSQVVDSDNDRASRRPATAVDEVLFGAQCRSLSYSYGPGQRPPRGCASRAGRVTRRAKPRSIDVFGAVAMTEGISPTSTSNESARVKNTPVRTEPH